MCHAGSREALTTRILKMRYCCVSIATEKPTWDLPVVGLVLPY